MDVPDDEQQNRGTRRDANREAAICARLGGL
jgi:hypothetical protein